MNENVKIEIVAAVIRFASNHTNLIAKEDEYSEVVRRLFGGESLDRRQARAIVREFNRVKNGAKKISTNRKFKKITTNF